jgi:hypothetical protein
MYVKSFSFLRNLAALASLKKLPFWTMLSTTYLDVLMTSSGTTYHLAVLVNSQCHAAEINSTLHSHTLAISTNLLQAA